MQVEKEIRPDWESWMDKIQNYNGPKLKCGKYQYICSSDKGKIKAMENFPNVFKLELGSTWEIHCLEGNLFAGIERFNTREEAELRIQRLLD